MAIEITASVLDAGSLTAREAQIVTAVCEGKTDKEISNQLGIAKKTVGIHLGNIYQKIGMKWSALNNRSTLIVYLIAKNMVKVTIALVILLIVCGVGFSSNIGAYISPNSPSFLVADNGDDDSDDDDSGSCGRPTTAVSK